jgi:hypothetical protein
MASFNTFRAQRRCPACNIEGEFDIQFRYGDTWQYIYFTGDELKWGGNDVGTVRDGRVLINGISGPCKSCNADFIEFDILLEDNKFKVGSTEV